MLLHWCSGSSFLRSQERLTPQMGLKMRYDHPIRGHLIWTYSCNIWLRWINHQIWWCSHNFQTNFDETQAFAPTHCDFTWFHLQKRRDYCGLVPKPRGITVQLQCKYISRFLKLAADIRSRLLDILDSSLAVCSVPHFLDRFIGCKVMYDLICSAY